MVFEKKGTISKQNPFFGFNVMYYRIIINSSFILKNTLNYAKYAECFSNIKHTVGHKKGNFESVKVKKMPVFLYIFPVTMILFFSDYEPTIKMKMSKLN